MGVVILRTFILYAAIVLGLRIMGKRQVGDMQPSELVVTILMSEVAAVPMQSNEIPIVYGLLSLFTLVATEIVLSYISMKSVKARQIVSGHPIIVIEKGRVIQKELSRLRITMDDIFEELRLQQVSKLADVSYAVLETNGKLSILLKPSEETPTRSDLKIEQQDPGPISVLVRDGVPDIRVMQKCGIDQNRLKKLLKEQGTSLEDVFFCTVDGSGNLWEIEVVEK